MKKTRLAVALAVAFIALSQSAWAQVTPVNPVVAGTNAAITTNVVAANTATQNALSNFGRPVFINTNDLAKAATMNGTLANGASSLPVPLPQEAPPVMVDPNAAKASTMPKDPTKEATDAARASKDAENKAQEVAQNQAAKVAQITAPKAVKSHTPTLKVYNGRPDDTPIPELQMGYDTFNAQEAAWGKREQKFTEIYNALDSKPTSNLSAQAGNDIELRMAIEKAQSNGHSERVIKEKLTQLSPAEFKQWSTRQSF